MLDPRLSYSATEPSLAVPPKNAPLSFSQAAAPYVAEFVGTFVLVMTMGYCLMSPADPTWTSTAVGCVLTAMVYATGPVSGGHLNPAVSFTLGLIGNRPWPEVLGYWAAQLSGGLAAGCCFVGLFSPRTLLVKPGPPFPWQYAATCEAIYSFMLCFVVARCTVSRRSNSRDDANQFYGLAIGFVVVAGGYAAGGISGACFNPAVALGLDVSVKPSKSTGWSFAWVAAELFGAAAAAALFRATCPEDAPHVATNVPVAAPSEPQLATRCLGEFLGTFMLMLSIGLNVTMGSPVPALSAAAALMCMVYALSGVSPCHFNPAVSFAAYVHGWCSRQDAVAYASAQLFAGAVGGVISGAFHLAGPQQALIFPLGPGRGWSPAAAGAVELFFTFVVAYTVLATSAAAPQAATKQMAYRGLAVGASFAVGGLAAGAVSGGELNPAVCLGMAVENVYHGQRADRPQYPIANFLFLSVWELLGGILAAAAFRWTHPGEQRRLSAAHAALVGERQRLFV